VVAVVSDIPNGKSLEVIAVVPDVTGGSGKSLEVLTDVPDVPVVAESRWK